MNKKTGKDSRLNFSFLNLHIQLQKNACVVADLEGEKESLSATSTQARRIKPSSGLGGLRLQLTMQQRIVLCADMQVFHNVGFVLAFLSFTIFRYLNGLYREIV